MVYLDSLDSLIQRVSSIPPCTRRITKGSLRDHFQVGRRKGEEFADSYRISIVQQELWLQFQVVYCSSSESNVGVVWKSIIFNWWKPSYSQSKHSDRCATVSVWLQTNSRWLLCVFALCSLYLFLVCWLYNVQCLIHCLIHCVCSLRVHPVHSVGSVLVCIVQSLAINRCCPNIWVTVVCHLVSLKFFEMLSKFFETSSLQEEATGRWKVALLSSFFLLLRMFPCVGLMLGQYLGQYLRCIENLPSQFVTHKWSIERVYSFRKWKLRYPQDNDLFKKTLSTENTNYSEKSYSAGWKSILIVSYYAMYALANDPLNT